MCKNMKLLMYLFLAAVVFGNVGASVLDKLPANTLIALKSIKKGKYLKIVDGKYLSAIGTTPDDKECQFKLLRDGNNIGLERLSDGKRLQATPNDASLGDSDRVVARFENTNFAGWEKWTYVPYAGENDLIHLKSSHGGYLNVSDPVLGGDWYKGRAHIGARAFRGSWYLYDSANTDSCLKIVLVGDAASKGVGFSATKIPANTIVALKSLPYGKYLKIVDGKYLSAIGTTPDDKECQFKLLRDGNNIGLERLSDGKRLQATPNDESLGDNDRLVARFENTNFAGWEKWTVVPVGDENDVFISLKSSHNGYLHVPDPSKTSAASKGRVHIGYKSFGYKGWRSGWYLYGSRGEYELLKIVDTEVAAAEKKRKEEAAAAQKAQQDFRANLTAKLAVNVATASDADVAAALVVFREALTKAYLTDGEKASAKEGRNNVLRRQNPDAVPGGKSFTYIPELHEAAISWHENWKFADYGKGWMKFKMKSKEGGVLLCLSSQPQDSEAMYVVYLGSANNTTSGIKRSLTGADVLTINMLAGGNPEATITGGLPGDGTMWDDYWIKVDKGTVTFGKGTTVGAPWDPVKKRGELGRWVDPNPLLYTKYVGFGCNARGMINVSNLEFSGIEIVEVPVNLPEGFEAEEGRVKRLTVGSRDGELEVWVVAFDDQLYRYDTYSMAANPWIKQEFKDNNGVIMKFEDVSCASDGTMVAVGLQGKALRYDWNNKVWNPIDPGKGNEAIDLEFITAGNKSCIWVTDVDDKNIYELTKEGWKKHAAGVAAYVAAGFDGAVVSLNVKGEAFSYQDGKWFGMPGVKLERVAVGNKDHIIGLTEKDNALWQWKGDKWEPMIGKDGKPATGLDEIAVNAVGIIFGADEDGDVYHKGEAGVALTKPTAVQVKAEIDKAIAAGKPAPKPEVVEKKLSVAKKAVSKKAATRARGKKEGKIKKKAVKKKTSGKGKALKRGAKIKKKIKKLDKKAKKKAAKKVVGKAAKKVTKKAAKKAAKKPIKKSAEKATKKPSSKK